MSLSRDTVLELMALADGELDGEDKAQAERVVAESAEARALLDGFRSAQVARWLASMVEERAPMADGIADKVMARVAEQGAKEGVGSLADARARRRWDGLGAPAAFAALSLAAGIAIVVGGGERQEPVSAPVASVALPPAAEEAVPPTQSAVAQRGNPTSQAADPLWGVRPTPLGVEVNDIDSPSRDVSVFEIPVGTSATAAANAKGPSSVVIMIEDDSTK
jgi:hypothetical protein